MDNLAGYVFRQEEKSLFLVKDGYSFQSTKKGFREGNAREVEVESRFMLKEFGITELLILKALYKYQWLNYHNLEKYLNVHLKNSLQKPKYDSNIKRLLKTGAIVSIQYAKTEAPESDRNRLVIYMLGKGAYSYMRNNYQNLAVTYRCDEESLHYASGLKEADVLERMSLNQWHIEMLSSYSDQVKEEAYYSKKRIGFKKDKMLSYIAVRKGKCEEKKRMSFAAIPGARSEENIAKMEYHLKKIDRVISESGKKDVLIVITCATMAHIRLLNERILKDNAIGGLLPVYVLDNDTSEGTQMDGLYMYETDEQMNGIYDTYSIQL